VGAAGRGRGGWAVREAGGWGVGGHGSLSARMYTRGGQEFCAKGLPVMSRRCAQVERLCFRIDEGLTKKQKPKLFFGN
jgi:hypothetical protein